MSNSGATNGVIIRPYDPQRRLWVGWRVLLGMLLVFVSAIYGLLAAVLPMQLITYPLAPILVIAGICLWLLPEIGGRYDAFYEKLMLWVLGLQAIWPYYIALNIPGLPYIGPMRIVVAMLVGTYLFNIATSADMRKASLEALNTVPLVNRLFWAFWALTTVTLLWATGLSASFGKYMNNQVFWTLFFIVSVVVAQRPGMIRRSVKVLVATAIPVAILGIVEFRYQSVFWAKYIPDFMMARDELGLTLLESSARSTTPGDYRVRGTFTVALYFAEYLAMMYPLALHLLVTTREGWKKILLLAGLVALIAAGVLTGSRSAMIGVFLTLGLYTLLSALRLRAENPNSLFASIMLAIYPVAAGMFVALLFTWNRLKVMVLGGGQHQASNDARDQQWERGLEILQSNPFGHGASQSAIVLGFYNRGGELTIDSYYLSLLLEYSVLALPIFVVMFSIPLIFSFQVVQQKVEDDELALLMPLGICLFNFIIIKAVLSGTTSIPLAFVMLGMCLVLYARLQALRAGLPSKGSKLPAVRYAMPGGATPGWAAQAR